MKKYISLTIFTAFLFSSLCFSQSRPGGKPGENGKPDSSSLRGKPSGGQKLDRPLPRELIDAKKEIETAVKNKEISRHEAGKKLKELHDKFKQNVKEKRPEKPELPDDVKAGLDAIKDKKDALQADLKETLEALGKDATKEERKEAVEKFKEANKERHQAIKAEYDALREQIKESRPERPDRPQIELSDELKADLEAIKEKKKELHEAQKALHEKLKGVSAEERQAMIAEFKEANKERHNDIKEKSKALKKEVREQIEIDETRTSDL